MYNLILAEDDEQVRITLEKIIMREYPDFNICCSCSNGLDAKKCIDDGVVDVVVLDINMPGMTGLELAEYIKNAYEKTLIVIVSAYREFEYVHKALHCNVVDYILKPITKASICSVMSKVKEILDDRKKKTFLDEDDSIRRQQLFFNLMFTGTVLSRKSIVDQLKDFNVFIDFENYPCAGIEFSITDYDDFIKSKWHREKDMFFEALSKILLADYSSSHFSFISHNNERIEIVSISKHTDKNRYCSELESDIEKIKEHCEDFFALTVRARITRMADNIDEYITVKDIDEKIKNRISFIVNYLIDGKKEYALKCIDDAEESIHSPEKLLEFYRNAVFGIMNMLDYSHKHADKLKILNIAAGRNIDEAKNSVVAAIDTAYSALFKTGNGENEMVEQAISYINKNYRNDISLDDIANAVSLNSCYFSSVFKKYTGKSFTNYLAYVRLEEAKRLLEDGNIKIAAIASMVGYKDESYFYRSFKGTYGCTPKEYKNKILDK